MTAVRRIIYSFFTSIQPTAQRSSAQRPLEARTRIDHATQDCGEHAAQRVLQRRLLAQLRNEWLERRQVRQHLRRSVELSARLHAQLDLRHARAEGEGGGALRRVSVAPLRQVRAEAFHDERKAHPAHATTPLSQLLGLLIVVERRVV